MIHFGTYPRILSLGFIILFYALMAMLDLLSSANTNNNNHYTLNNINSTSISNNTNTLNSIHNSDDEYNNGNDNTIIISKLFTMYCALFVLISIIMYYNVKSIYKKILKNAKIDHSFNNSNSSSSSPINHNHPRTTNRQKENTNPQYIIYMTQFIQQIYAISLSILIVWKPEIQDQEKGQYYLVWICLICCTIFIMIISNVLPNYILCTSLGDEVDVCTLRKTLAHFCLKEKLARINKEQEEDDDDNRNSNRFISNYNSEKQEEKKDINIDEEKKNYEILHELVYMDIKQIRQWLKLNPIYNSSQQQVKENATKPLKNENVDPNFGATTFSIATNTESMSIASNASCSMSSTSSNESVKSRAELSSSSSTSKNILTLLIFVRIFRFYFGCQW